jgi:hypothetical protein
MFRSLFLSSALLAASVMSAQTYVHQVLVLNEGYFNFNTLTQEVPVSLGSFDPVTGSYQTVATINGARFGNYVAVDGNAIYVSADEQLLKYDATNFTLLDQATVPGIRRFAFHNDEMVITLGEVGGLPHYVEVRDKNTFELLYNIDPAVLPYSCEAVQVVGDKAYIGVNNAFDWSNLRGEVRVLDLATQTWEPTIDLGVNGVNPENILVKEDAVYAFNNTDFTGSSISRISLQGALEYTINVATSSGCASSAMVEDRVYFMEYAQNELSRFNLTTATVEDTLAGSPATYGLIHDPVNNVLYGTTTDFVTSGTLHVMDLNGAVLSSVPVGVSPGKLALDTRSATGINEIEEAAATVFPMPATDRVTINLPAGTTTRVTTVLDAAGRAVRPGITASVAQVTMDIAALPAGLYTVVFANGMNARFSKQ